MVMLTVVFDRLMLASNSLLLPPHIITVNLPTWTICPDANLEKHTHALTQSYIYMISFDAVSEGLQMMHQCEIPCTFHGRRGIVKSKTYQSNHPRNPTRERPWFQILPDSRRRRIGEMTVAIS